MRLFVLWAVLLVGAPFFATAQLTVLHPMPRLVVQRGINNTGRLYVSGQYVGDADRVEAQLTPVTAGQGSATAWQTVQVNPTDGRFMGYITGTGGWYVLTVRTVLGGSVVTQATVQPVGIGEVFITAGQSNSRGLGIGDNDLGTATDRVNGIDSINHYYPPAPPQNQPLFSSGDPMPVPVYSPLTARRRIFPMAESTWGWGELGDYIVNRFNVPVAFYVTGWDASTAENWYNSANGIPTCNFFNCAAGNWPNLQPYTNLRNVLTYYAPMAGVRAVLWHQGEGEWSFPDGNTSIPYYYDRLTGIIQKSRQDFGGRNLPWVVARVSFDGNQTRPAVVTEQQRVIDTPGLNVFQGPLNDTIMNRNGGAIDVHFRNGSRPAPHPRYYLTPGSIPVSMGLSRFARNWNNSLNNTFFQNAQPMTPVLFAATRPVAPYARPGSSLTVVVDTLGRFGSGNTWQVQLLDARGRYRAALGSGSGSSVAVVLPDTLTLGRQYRLRLVATSPGYAAVPTNMFMVVSQLPSADLSLSMSVDQRSPALNEAVVITTTVQNDGPDATDNVVVRNRLPPGLKATSASAGVTLSGSVVLGTIARISPGETATFSYTALPTADATYQNAAEVAQSSVPDPDSQPNSGTGDGQDDAATVDFRTWGTGALVNASPNPNQVPLPPVQANQPAPAADKADISLSMQVSNRAPRPNDVVSVSLTLSNAGGLTATGLSATAYLPANLSFVPGNDFGLSGGNPVGGVSSLAAGQRITLVFRATVAGSGTGLCRAQLTAANQPDPDSTPNNGTTNGEDDTAQVDIRVSAP